MTRTASTRTKTLITGASSGIGKHLAYELAQRGHDLALIARREDALERVAAKIQRLTPEAQVWTHSQDVTDTDGMVAAVNSLATEMGGIDVGIVNAGIARGGKAGKGHLDEHLQTLNVNVLGAVATCDALMTHFRSRQSGQLVGISSVAAERGLPRNAAYCASKAALSTYLEALRIETRRSPICVSTIKPGFIDTPINRDAPSRPFLIDVQKGAKLIADAIERRVSVTYVPRWPWALLAPLLRWFPRPVLDR